MDTVDRTVCIKFGSAQLVLLHDAGNMNRSVTSYEGVRRRLCVRICKYNTLCLSKRFKVFTCIQVDRVLYM
jgi:hypothetical protein